MQATHHLRQKSSGAAALLIAALAAPLAVYADGMPPAAAASSVNAGTSGGIDPATGAVRMFAARVDSRGYIDVWQLRRDLASIVPADEPPAWELERCAERGMEEQACSAKLRAPYDSYVAARKALNETWLPALLNAMHRGDAVAEVILRRCGTTPLLDRSHIESDCDPSPQIRQIAAARLKATGFAPAFVLEQEPGFVEPKPSSAGARLARQQVIVGAIQQGSLGQIPQDVLDCRHGERDRAHAALLIGEARRRVRQAFAFGMDAAHPDDLLLNRQPLRPEVPDWGAATIHSAGADVFLQSMQDEVQRNGGGPRAYEALNECWGLTPDTEAELDRLLAAEEANIARYLKQDPRWGVFLMKRIGHHEWLPADMQPAALTLGKEWLGRWVLVNSYTDFELPAHSEDGHAEIFLDGSGAHITIDTGHNQAPGLKDVTACTLRAGGVARSGYQGWNTSYSALGNLDRLVAGGALDYIGRHKPWVDRETQQVYSLEPLGENGTFRQVLMQCEGAETPRGEQVRFLLLGQDGTLVEVASYRQHGTPIYVRHYTRTGEVPGFTAQRINNFSNYVPDPLLYFAGLGVAALIGFWIMALARREAKAAEGKGGGSEG